MCKSRQITNKLNIKPRALFSLRVIRHRLHIDNIHKNKIKMHFYNKIQ